MFPNDAKQCIIHALYMCSLAFSVLFEAKRNGKKSKQVFGVTPGNRTRNLLHSSRAVTDCANTNRASAVSIATFIRGQKSTQASSGVKQNAIYALLACCKCVVLPLL